MNKKQLIEAVAQELSSTKNDAEKAINAVVECIKKGVAKDDTVQLVGFGSFKIRKRKARTGRNPQNGQAIKIKASKTVAFRPGKALKEVL